MTGARFTPLGGVGTFGRNCLLVEDDDTGAAVVIDCGVRFLGDDAPGFDVGLPDVARIATLGDRLQAYVVTHGHEDHIGALPHAFARRPAPIFATPFTARLIQARFARMGAAPPTIDVVQLGDTRALGPFSATWLAVSHSIPDASCVALRTAAGVVVHSGDFRVDDDPVIGAKTDLDGLSALGDAGVALLLADSTGATLPGRNAGERSVAPAFDALFASATGRVVVATFASHVSRAVVVLDACRRAGRKACLLGRGLQDAIRAATELGVLDASDVLVDEGELGSLPASRTCLLVTGSQGEPAAALAKLADENPHVPRLVAGDVVVVSARVIPGNERRMATLVDRLIDHGVQVLDGSKGFHVSGHGHRGDLELLLAATRPRAFAALHGGARHLVAHGDLAAVAGLDARRVVELRDGATLALSTDGTIAHRPAPRAAEPYAYDQDVVDDPAPLVARRRRMATGGVVLVVVDQDGVVLRGHALLPGAAERYLIDAQVEADRAWREGGDDVDEKLVRAATKPWRRARAPVPEVVLVGAGRRG